VQPSAHGEEEGHAHHTAKAMVGIYFASKDHMEAYSAFLDAHRAEGHDERKLVDELVSRLRELVARCQLYLREHPQEEESIELVLDELLLMKGDKEVEVVLPTRRKP
jgi:hypothetical protein